MAKQHQVILETEDPNLAKYIVDLFADGTLTNAINLEGEVFDATKVEIFVDESPKNEFKKHKIQL